MLTAAISLCLFCVFYLHACVLMSQWQLMVTALLTANLYIIFVKHHCKANTRTTYIIIYILATDI